MTAAPYQLLPPLSDEQRHLLRQSIEKNGVLEAVVFDEDGEILDGHHRVEIAEELGIEYPRRVVEDLDEAGKQLYALTVNVARRQLSQSERGSLVVQLRSRGMSIREIAKATGVSRGTVANDLAQVSNSGHLPDTVTGADGKSYAASRPAPAPAAAPEPEDHPADTGEGRSAGLPSADLAADESDASVVASVAAGELPAATCEWCDGEITQAGVDANYRRCDGCDPDGEHYDRDGVCLGCNPPADEPELVAGQDYRSDRAERIAAVAEVAPEFVRPAEPEPGPDPVAMVAAALDQFVPDPNAGMFAWRKDLHERLGPIHRFTVWIGVDDAAEFASADDVETIRQLALSFADLHRRIVAARQGNVVPLRAVR